jgi:hypothetical protein
VQLKLRKLDKLSGNKASFYTIIENEKDSLFAAFLTENQNNFTAELLDILARIKSMGEINGATDNFFKTGESADPADDKVMALYDKPGSRLRLYCVKISDQLIVL